MDAKYEDNRRIYQLARSTAVLTAAITAFIAFVAFMIAGFSVQNTLAWMLALAIMSGSALFVAMFITMTTALKKEQTATV